MGEHMKICSWLLRSCVLLLACGIFAAGWTAYTPMVLRSVSVINPHWKFVRGDASGASAENYSENSMQSLNLPHSFDIPYWRENTAKSPYIGWYRKHFTISQADIDTKQRFFIEFEGAYHTSKVYVNGNYVGMHKGGFTGFSFDITSLVHVNDNVVAVRLDATKTDTIAPFLGDFIFVGGIYRNVYLVKTNPLHVTWCGTFVSTPQVNVTSPASATIKMKTEIKNDGAAPASCRVKNTVVDSAGNQVTSFESTGTVAAGMTVTFVQTSSAVSNIRLWSPSSPYMYTVYTEVYSGTMAVDNFQSPLGIRTIRWTTTNGFELNGKRLWLQGANSHQDRAGWCYAATNSGSYRDVKLIKDCGMNFVRGSHYPHAPAFSDACDKLGLCLWSESVFWGFVGGGYAENALFKQSCLDQTREMIRIHRNHPSIIMWSMGNELWFPTQVGIPIDSCVSTLTRMIAVAHAEDSTRPAGVGGVTFETEKLAAPCDVVGFNGSSSTWSSKPQMCSEYGSCIDTSWVDRSLTLCWNGEGDGGRITMGSTDVPAQPPYSGGIALWCAFHHGSVADNFGGTSIYNYSGLMGMINHARIPLQRWYVYRNKFLGTPLPVWPVNGTPAKLKLTTDRDIITDDGTTDALLIVQVQDASGRWLLNSPAITLTDASGLGSFPDIVPNSTAITFRTGPKVTDVLDKGVRNGLAGIEFRSYNAGTVKIVASSPSLGKDSVTITVVHVPDPLFSHAAYVPAISPVPGPQEMVAKSYGSRITLPPGMAGKMVEVSLFDIRGRLVGQMTPGRARVIIRRDAAPGIVIAKVKVVR